jgi:nitrite reductase/ring-hydroxylating ferredoxin subunit
VAGGTLATATAYIGGHLVFGRGIGVDTTAFDALPDRWTTAIHVADVSLEKPVLAEVGGVPLVVVQTEQGFHVLHDRCTHRGGPLHEGATDGRTITCPWHGSCFRLDDGGIVTGPATAPQPSLEVRVREGALQVRRART